LPYPQTLEYTLICEQHTCLPQIGIIYHNHLDPVRTKVFSAIYDLVLFGWPHDTQYNDIQHNDIQHNDIQHNDIQHNDIQHNDIQHNCIQHNDIQHNDIQHYGTQHNDI
jgi:hypothetical protein